MKFKHLLSKSFMFVSEWKTYKFWLNGSFETSDKEVLKSLKNTCDFQNWLIEEIEEMKEEKTDKKTKESKTKEVVEVPETPEEKTEEVLEWENFENLEK